MGNPIKLVYSVNISIQALPVFVLYNRITEYNVKRYGKLVSRKTITSENALFCFKGLLLSL